MDTPNIEQLQKQLALFNAKAEKRREQQKKYRDKKKLSVETKPIDEETKLKLKAKKNEYMKTYSRKNASRQKEKRDAISTFKRDMVNYKLMTHEQLLDALERFMTKA